MVSEIRVRGDCSPFPLPWLTAANLCPRLPRRGPGRGCRTGAARRWERSWGGRAGPVLPATQDGGMRGGCYRSEKQAQK